MPLILLIEDNPSDAKQIARLVDEGLSDQAQLEHTANLTDALRQMCTESFDVVLLDQQLPDASGSEAVARLNGLPGCPPIIMLTGLVIVMIWLARLGMRTAPSDPIKQDYEAEIPEDVSMPMALLWFLLGFGTLLGGAHLLVDGSLAIAEALGVSQVVIGILLVALGTSLPELVAALAAVRRNQLDIAVGGIVGSNIFNTLLVAGATSLVRPMQIPRGGHLDLAVTILLSLILMLNARSHNRSIIRSEGAILLSIYLSYMIWRVVTIGPPT